MKFHHHIINLLILLLITGIVYSQNKSGDIKIKNDGFEGWDHTTTTGTKRLKKPIDWMPLQVPYPSDSTDIVPETKNVVDDNLGLVVETGRDSIFGAMEFNQRIAARDSIFKINGFYQFQGAPRDSIYFIARISEGSTFKTSTSYAHAKFHFKDTVKGDYKKFSASLKYSQPLNTDSVTLELALVSLTGDTMIADSGMVLKLDSLHTNSKTITSGISKMPAQPTLKITPNPSHDQLLIHYPALEERGPIKIYNSTGQLVRQHKTTRNSLKIDVHELPRGMYFLQLSGSPKSITRKVIIK